MKIVNDPLSKILRAPNLTADPKDPKDLEIGVQLGRYLGQMVLNSNWKGTWSLAAPQVGINKRIVAVVLDDHTILVLFNPRIAGFPERIGEDENMEWRRERCPCNPGISVEKARFKQMSVVGTRLNGEEIVLTLTGMPARGMHHALEHVVGKGDCFDISSNTVRKMEIVPEGQRELFELNRMADIYGRPNPKL